METSGSAIEGSNQKALEDAFHAYCQDFTPGTNKNRRKQRRQIRDAILSWSSKNDSELTLTLSSLNLEELYQLPQEVVMHLADQVHHLVLPRYLNNTDRQPPPWLESLTEIKEITFPDYQDEVLEARRIYPKGRYTLSVLGNHIDVIHCSEQADVYSPEVTADVNVRVYYYLPDKKTEVHNEQAMGYVREVTPRQEEQYRFVNNNNQTQFSDGIVIGCGNIAAHSIMSQQAYRSGSSSSGWLFRLFERQKGIFSRKKKRSERLLEELETTKKVKQNISPLTELIQHELRTRASENFLVGHSQWGSAFAHIFSKMPLNSEKHLYVTTGSHGLSLYLRRKLNVLGQQRFIIELADPNLSVVYKTLCCA